MAARTVGDMIANVQRKVGPSVGVPLGEIADALNVANRKVHSLYEWPWTYKEYNVPVQASYSTGTITLTPGLATVTGAGTTWVGTWTNKRLLVGNVDWPILSVGGAGTLTLEQTYNGGAVLTGNSYTIYQDTYPMPTDFEPGQDMILMQPDIRLQIRCIPRYSLEQQTNIMKNFFTNLTLAYADAGRQANGQYLIKLVPPPSSYNNYRLVYKARPADLNLTTDFSGIPESFQDVLELMAEAEVKRVKRIEGWDVAAAIAAKGLVAMKRQTIAHPVNNSATQHGGSVPGDSSISWRGMTIGPWAP